MLRVFSKPFSETEYYFLQIISNAIIIIIKNKNVTRARKKARKFL